MRRWYGTVRRWEEVVWDSEEWYGTMALFCFCNELGQCMIFQN